MPERAMHVAAPRGPSCVASRTTRQPVRSRSSASDMVQSRRWILLTSRLELKLALMECACRAVCRYFNAKVALDTCKSQFWILSSQCVPILVRPSQYLCYSDGLEIRLTCSGHADSSLVSGPLVPRQSPLSLAWYSSRVWTGASMQHNCILHCTSEAMRPGPGACIR
jgi:hypothetical protein